MCLIVNQKMTTESEEVFKQFIEEVKTIEENDSVYTSEKQISRLLRPGSSYANLNPFEVLLVNFDASVEDIRKQYKKLSILLHPDKNLGNREKAQSAFDVVNKAYRILDNELSRNRALEVVEEAKFKVNQICDEKRKKLKKEGKSEKIEEDDPEKYNQAIKVMTMKLFADYERKRRAMEERNMEERKRKREEEIQEEEKKKQEQEWNKNYEESREVRVNSWKSFQSTNKTKRKEFRPPKHKPESK